MAHVIHSINVTLSGNCHHEDAVTDEQHHDYAIELLESSEALLLGRNTFDLFNDFWPSAVNNSDLPSWTVKLAKELEMKRKYVLSSKAVETKWQAVERIPSTNLDALKSILSNVRCNVLILGSPRLGASLLQAELIDEIHILCQPLIGVAGPQAYSSLNARRELKLIDAKPFPSGAVLLRYAA